MIRNTLGVLAAVTLILGCTDNSGGSASVVPTTGPGTTVTVMATTTEPAQQRAPHVFVIMMENNGFEQSFGSNTPMPYLATELTAQGALLTQYFGITHASQGNYLAQISGQAPNRATQADCSVYSEFVQTGEGEYGQALGNGCVFPANVLTIADQLEERGLTWRAYAEDMAATPGSPEACRHPELGTRDTTLHARVTDDYATRHVPFVYFHSIIDSPDCATNVVDLGLLEPDLAALATTPNLAYIVPDLCGDGHDGACADGTRGGPARADDWLRTWVPKILASPAMQAGGLLIITFDEAESSGSQADETNCCGSLPAPNIPTANGFAHPGGGRIGAVLIGPAITPGTVSDTAYNHYSLLCSMERLWGLELLGYAGHPETPCFGDDVYTADPAFATA